LVLAKSREICTILVQQFSKRQIKKSYLAIARGNIKEDEFEVNRPLGKLRGSLIRLKIGELSLEEGGQEAITHFKVIRRFRKPGLERPDYTLLECSIKTGRQHQIRAHLDLEGHPLVGDKLYGLPESTAVRFFDSSVKSRNSEDDPLVRFIKGLRQITPEMKRRLILPRHALHAHRIELKHPRTGEVMRFEAPLPPDLRSFIDESKSTSD